MILDFHLECQAFSKAHTVVLENFFFFTLPQVKHKYHWRACCLATFLPELQEGVNVVLRTSALLAFLSCSLSLSHSFVYDLLGFEQQDEIESAAHKGH